MTDAYIVTSAKQLYRNLYGNSDQISEDTIEFVIIKTALQAVYNGGFNDGLLDDEPDGRDVRDGRVD